MAKMLVIAVRDYLAAVKTKSFIITLFLMPVLMGGSALVQGLMKKQSSTEPKKFAIIDRSPGAKLFALLKEAAQKRNERELIDPESGRTRRAPFVLESVTLDKDTTEAIDELRLQLSQRAKNDEIWGFVEIGPDVLSPLSFDNPSKDRVYFRYQTNHPTYEEFPNWLQNQLLIATSSLSARMSQEAIMKRMEQQHVLLLRREGLSERDPPPERSRTRPWFT